MKSSAVATGRGLEEEGNGEDSSPLNLGADSSSAREGEGDWGWKGVGSCEGRDMAAVRGTGGGVGKASTPFTGGVGGQVSHKEVV